MINLFDLKQQVALITGSGSGLGRAIAKGLAGVGVRVALVDIQAAAIQNTFDSITAESGEGLALPADVTKSEQVKTAVQLAIARFGRIDILVNCAGITRRMPAEEFAESDWDLVIDVNLKGTFLCCREVGKHMLGKGSGSIINIASLGAHVVFGKPEELIGPVIFLASEASSYVTAQILAVDGGYLAQ